MQSRGSGVKNLYGYQKHDDKQKFTWQSGGQQFTIFEILPKNYITINIKKPDLLPKEFILNEIGFESSWITVTKNG